MALLSIIHDQYLPLGDRSLRNVPDRGRFETPTVVRCRCRPAVIAASLVAYAREIGAAYIVMGGYSHSRIKEIVFGGVTRSLLKEWAIPLVIAH